MESTTANGLTRYRVEELEKRVAGLEEKIDRLIMATVVAAFTCAGALVLLAINLLTIGRR